MNGDLRQKAVRALGSSSLGSILGKVVSLSSTLVLVRLLAPEDFGLMAMATTVTGFVGFFNEIGIGAAIVQQRDVREEELGGCLGIAMLASALLCVLVIALSWPAASFFDMPKLQPVLAVLGFGFFFGAMNTVPIALLKRSLRLQALIWLGITATSLQAMVTIGFAALGFKYWAIVGGFFVGQTVATLWYWRASGWRPQFPLQLREGRALLGYGINITFTRVLWHLYMNVDKLIIGKLLGAKAVGIYDVSRSLATLPTSQISGLVSGIASPIFARLQDDRERLRQAQLRLIRGVAYVAFPLLGGMAVLAPELVRVLLGEAWGEAVIPLQALCISEAVACVMNLQAQLLISTGEVKRLVRFNTICAVVMPVAIALGAWQLGLVGVALAWAVTFPLLSLWLNQEALRCSGLALSQLVAALRPPVMASGLMVLAVAGFREVMVLAGQHAAVTLSAGIATGALAYGFYVIYLDRAGLRELVVVLSDFGVPSRVLDRWPFNRTQPTTDRT